MNLSAYEEAANYRAVHKIDSRISNSSKEHARILIKAMIEHAGVDDDLYIYSGALPEDIFDPLISTKAKKIHVLVDDVAGIDWIKSENLKDRVEIFQIKTPRPNHFLCTSGGFFRYETNPLSFAAEANFNEPPVVTKLISAFDRYTSDSARIQ